MIFLSSNKKKKETEIKRKKEKRSCTSIFVSQKENHRISGSWDDKVKWNALYVKEEIFHFEKLLNRKERKYWTNS